MSIAPLDTAAKPRTEAADTVSLSIDKSASSAARVAISSSYTSAVNRGVLTFTLGTNDRCRSVVEFADGLVGFRGGGCGRWSAIP